jgi:hypothetical protein
MTDAKMIGATMTDMNMIRRPSNRPFRSFALVRVGLCLFALLTSAIAQGQLNANANPAAQKLPQQKSPKNAAADAGCKPAPVPLECPAPANAAASKPVAALNPATTANPRTVRLTWNANPTTANPGTNAVGYCLYRATTQKTFKTILDCKNCELVTKFAVTGPDLGCIDNVTQPGKTYYYVVAAINQCGRISSASNEAMAEIDKPRPKTASEKPLPSCRKNDLK